MVDLLERPPEPSTIPPDAREFLDLQLADALVAMGRQDRAAFVERMKPLLSKPSARPVIFDALSEVKPREALAPLAPLCESPELTDNELVRLAIAIGEIGGTEAMVLLERMRVAAARGRPEVLVEIDASLEQMAHQRNEQEVLERALIDSITAMGRKERESFAEHITPLAQNDETLPALLDLLSAVGAAEGLSWLAALSTQIDWPNRGLFRLIRALEECGGAEAQAGLKQLLMTPEPPEPETILEVERALARPASPGSAMTDAARKSLEESMGCLGRRDRAGYQRAVGPLLVPPGPRTAFIHMMDVLSAREALAWLVVPIWQVPPEPKDLVQLVQALARAGGVEAAAALEQMRSSEAARVPGMEPAISAALKLIQAAGHG
ncbi:MAG TPA: hypothetical protein VK447_12000 [Myxococcaceae bacterium]|nr:hypothetical protein [Myxococcaceae bacterium]